MSLDLDATNASIRHILSQLYQMPIREANKNGPVGSVPFGTLLISEVDNVGVDQTEYVDQGVVGELLEVVSGQRKVTCSLQFFRDGAYNNASRVQGLLRQSLSIAACRQAGLGFIRSGNPTNISQVIDTSWEERAQVEIDFYVSSVEQSTIPTFATVPITIQLEDSIFTSEVNLDVDS